MPMVIKFGFEREVSDEFMQNLFTTMTESSSIDYWANPDNDAGQQGYIDWNEESIVAIYIIECEDVVAPGPRKFKIDGTVIRQGIERLLKGEVDMGAEQLGALLWAMHNDDTSELDGDVVDSIVQAGLYNDIIFG